jgi:hypothetical protein
MQKKVRKAFYVDDFPVVLSGLNAFNAVNFYDAVMTTLPAVGPNGEDTTKVKFRKQLKKAVSNWISRKVALGQLVKVNNTRPLVYRKAPTVQKRVRRYKNIPGPDSKPLVITHTKKQEPEAPKTPTTQPEAPQDGLTLLDIGKGIEALLNEARERRDHWKKAYYDKVRECEGLIAEMRDLKTDKENLNRKLDKQNSEILRLGNVARSGGKSSVALKDVARFKTRNSGAAQV